MREVAEALEDLSPRTAALEVKRSRFSRLVSWSSGIFASRANPSSSSMNANGNTSQTPPINADQPTIADR
jgi:hypothetical protein